MSLSARERRALDSIEVRLTGSDPRLAGLLGTFTRLASGEEMPAREPVRAGGSGQARRPRRRRQGVPTGGLPEGVPHAGWQLAGIVLSLLAGIGLVMAAGLGPGRIPAACGASWAAPCASRVSARPSHRAARKKGARPAAAPDVRRSRPAPSGKPAGRARATPGQARP